MKETDSFAFANPMSTGDDLQRGLLNNTTILDKSQLDNSFNAGGPSRQSTK